MRRLWAVPGLFRGDRRHGPAWWLRLVRADTRQAGGGYRLAWPSAGVCADVSGWSAAQRAGRFRITRAQSSDQVPGGKSAVSSKRRERISALMGCAAQLALCRRTPSRQPACADGENPSAPRRKKSNGVVEGFEQLADESIRRGGGDRKLYLAVAGGDVDAHLAAGFVDLEAGEPVGAGEDFASGGRGDLGVGVTPGDVYADLCAVGVVPFDRESVGGVLGDKPGHPWQVARAEAAEADEAHAAYGQARNELRAKRPRQQPGNEPGLDPVPLGNRIRLRS